MTFKFKLVILIFVFSALFCPLGLISSAGEYVYYRAVPSIIYYAKLRGALPGQEEYDLSKEFTIDPSSIANYGLLRIAAAENDTIVGVYEMPSNSLISECRLNEMRKHFAKIPNGTLFKVVSNKILSVLLVGGNVAGRKLEPDLPEASVAQALYTRSKGSFVGREFIFIVFDTLPLLSGGDSRFFCLCGFIIPSFGLCQGRPCCGHVAHSPLEYVHGSVVVCVACVSVVWAFEEASDLDSFMPAFMACL